MKLVTYIDDPGFWAYWRDLLKSGQNDHKSAISVDELHLFVLWRGLPWYSVSRWRLSWRLRAARAARLRGDRAARAPIRKSQIARETVQRGGPVKVPRRYLTGERVPE
jgi:hypothetical protein